MRFIDDELGETKSFLYRLVVSNSRTWLAPRLRVLFDLSKLLVLS